MTVPRDVKRWVDAHRDAAAKPPTVTDELVGLAEKIAGQDRDLAQQGGRVDAVTERLRENQAEAIDRAGLPQNLFEAERNVWYRIGPFRDRWLDVRKFNERAAELEQRQAEVHRRIAELGEQLLNAPGRDAQALSAWQLAGEQGPRPEPERPRIEAELEAAKLEWESFNHAVAAVLLEKTEYIDRHRKRLVHEADADVNQEHLHVHELIDQLEAGRQRLREKRRDAVWVRLYPDQIAGTEPPDSLAGGRMRPLQQMGLTARVAAERVFAGLRADADYVRGACTAEQSLMMEGRGDLIGKPPRTHWHDDPAVKAERDKAMADWANSR